MNLDQSKLYKWSYSHVNGYTAGLPWCAFSFLLLFIFILCGTWKVLNLIPKLILLSVSILLLLYIIFYLWGIHNHKRRGDTQWDIDGLVDWMTRH